jgi:mono/diheme cytochrome c family protein
MQCLETTRTLAMVMVTLLSGLCAHGQVNDLRTPVGKTSGSKDVPVTPVSDESWLVHLNRSFNETSMGKTGHLGPAAPAPGETALQLQRDVAYSAASQSLTLHGSDLYRLNCQGCHGESGQGAPPEINSVINPVRATSVALVMARMKTAGMDITRADAAKLAQQSNTALLQRLHNGGQNMPPFPHLNEAEIHSLFAYLKQLAGVPGAEGEQIAVKESPIRIGEHIVKSTCHTCHGAVGPDPDAQQLWDGAIPPLSVLTTRKSRPEFIRKVTHGTPILMGVQPALYRGRMPVFYYLSEDEAADVYLYLSLYPPSDSPSLNTAIALSQQGPAGGGGASGPPPPQKALAASFIPDYKLREVEQANRGTDMQTVVLLGTVGAFIVLLLAGGVGFTMHEFQRLSAGGRGKSLAVKTKSQGRAEDATATLQRVF